MSAKLRAGELHSIISGARACSRAPTGIREKVILALEKILRTKQFIIEDHQEAWMSFREYQAGGDFADSFIAAINRREGCAHTATFDRKAGRRPGFVLL